MKWENGRNKFSLEMENNGKQRMRVKRGKIPNFALHHVPFLLDANPFLNLPLIRI